MIDTNIITWIVLGVLAVFIFFKFKKFFPFKQDARSINYYHTEQYPIREKVTREIRTLKKEPVRRKLVNDDNYDDDYDTPNYDDIWSDIAKDNERIANEMFGFDRDDDKI